MRKHISFIIACFLLFSCKQINSQSVQKGENENTENKIDFNKEFEKALKFDLPYGSDLIFSDFPDYWDYSYHTSDKKKKQINEKYDKLLSELTFFYSIDKADLNRMKQTYDYNTSQLLAIPKFKFADAIKKGNEKQAFGVARIPLSKNFKSYTISYEGFEDCDTCEFRKYQFHNTLITVDKLGDVIDKLVLYQQDGTDLGSLQSYFYIDKSGIISILSRNNDELTTYFVSFEKYKTNDNGLFQRYYDNDGKYKTKSEEGNVVNHLREGKWVDMGFNNLYGRFVYIESEYKEGLLNGQRKIFRLEQQYDEKGFVILLPENKKELIRDEVYTNGILLK